MSVSRAHATDAAAPTPTEEGAEHAPSSLLANPIPPGVVVLDEDKLKRFLLYEGRLATMSASLMKESTGVVVLPDAGRPTRSVAGAESAALARQQATQTAAAVAASGFTQSEILDIERMVSTVLGRRDLARMPDREIAFQQSEEVLAQMHPEQRGALQSAAHQARADRAPLKSLSRERIHFGDSNVSLILQHEDELRRVQASAGADLAKARTIATPPPRE